MDKPEKQKSDPPLDRNWKQVSEQYKLVRKLGAGSSGEVVYSIHRTSRQKVAIKMIKIPSDNTLNYLRYFLREVQIMRELS